MLLALAVCTSATAATPLRHGMRGKAESSAAATVAPGVHLSLGRRTGEVVVTWSSPANRSSAALRYGLSPTALTTTVPATQTLLANNEGANGPGGVVGWRNITVNKASIANVAFEQTVFYCVGGEVVYNFTYTVREQENPFPTENLLEDTDGLLRFP